MDTLSASPVGERHRAIEIDYKMDKAHGNIQIE